MLAVFFITAGKGIPNMNKTRFRAILLLVLAVVCFDTIGVSQQLGIDTDEIESLIDEWNFANNTRNVHSFEKVYASNVLFYTENLTRRRAIALKQKLFESKPYFRQRITTEITYKPYSKGVVKCDFTKEVFERTYWKKYPSYLLVSYENNKYLIVAESDYATDRVLRFKPDIGEPITFEKSLDHPDTVSPDSGKDIPAASVAVSDSALQDSTTIAAGPATAPAQFDLSSLDPAVILSDIQSMGMVTVPVGYIFILIGMLVVGGLLIVVADSVRTTRRRRTKITKQHAEAEHVVRDFKTQSGFESFVLTLFDPLFFKCKRLKNEHVYAGKGGTAEKGPDFVIDYEQKDTHARFAIKCQYYANVAKNEVQLFTSERQRSFRQFEQDSDMDVYYVMGFGGSPDDPRELFFLPAKAVKGEYISKAALKQYSKSGMFYYNRNTGRIQ